MIRDLSAVLRLSVAQVAARPGAVLRAVAVPFLAGVALLLAM